MASDVSGAHARAEHSPPPAAAATGGTGRRRSVALTLLALAVLAVVGAVSPLGASGLSLFVDDEPAPALDCTTAAATYGDEVTCSAAGPEGSTIEWGDGHSSALGTSVHAPAQVGFVSVAVVSADGEVLVSDRIMVTPDLTVSCDAGDDRPVYELVADPAQPRGWNYVYHAPDGTRVVSPGDDGYPIDPGMTPLELVQIGSGPAARACTARSIAIDDLGGELYWEIETAWQEPKPLPVDSLTPWSKDHWVGVQPGTLTATVRIGTVEASERRGVYLSGCN